jgi:hypothetical protein
MSTIIDTASGKAMNLQAEHASAVTVSDTTVLSPGTLYVGVAGDVSVVTVGGETTTFSAVPAGTILPVQVTKVRATATIASGIVIMS